jgi:hypothetical protein
MEAARDALKFPAKTRVRIQLFKSFPPRRGFEFNFSKVSRQDEGSNSIFQKFPAKTTIASTSTIRRRPPARRTHKHASARPTLPLHIKKHTAKSKMGNRSGKASAGGHEEDGGSGLFLSPELQGERERDIIIVHIFFAVAAPLPSILSSISCSFVLPRDLCTFPFSISIRHIYGLRGGA